MSGALLVLGGRRFGGWEDGQGRIIVNFWNED